jgi:hypothetical protein
VDACAGAGVGVGVVTTPTRLLDRRDILYYETNETYYANAEGAQVFTNSNYKK